MNASFIILTQYRNPLAPKGYNLCTKGFKVTATSKTSATKKAKAELSSLFGVTNWHITGVYSEAEAGHTLEREDYGFFD